MSNSEFDFPIDEFMQTSTFREILNLTPLGLVRTVPTIYGPDKSFIFLASLEDFIKVDDADGLKIAIASLHHLYHATDPRDHRTLFFTEGDFTEACLLLSALEGDEELAIPNELLDDPDWRVC